MSKINFDSEKVKDIAIVGVIVVGVYLAYKVMKGITDAKGALGYGAERDKAEAIDQKVEDLKPEDNPFNPAYAVIRLKDGSGKTYILKTAAVRESMFKTITAKLGLFETYKHPLSFLDDRKKVSEYILKNIKSKMQLSNLSQTFKDHGKDLYTVLKEGYREQGLTSGLFKAGEVQALFTATVKKLLSLPVNV